MTLKKKIAAAYWLMTAAFAATLIILLAQTYSNAAAHAQAPWYSGLLLWLFKIAPFLLLVRGLLQKRHSTSSWLSFLSMLYFIFAVLLIFTPGGALYGWLMTASTLTLYVSSMLHTRWKKQLV
ncbi:MAG: hypothetical protein RL217_1014 [Pseudomonadota bacterium]|jgi:uncharacterized membrane protein